MSEKPLLQLVNNVTYMAADDDDNWGEHEWREYKYLNNLLEARIAKAETAEKVVDALFVFMRDPAFTQFDIISDAMHEYIKIGNAIRKNCELYEARKDSVK